MIQVVLVAIMIELIQQFFASTVMQETLPPALFIALVSSSISVMVLAHRLSFLTVGVSHASLAGLGLAVTFSLPLLPTATAFCVGIALLLASLPKKQGITEDTGTGLLFAGSMALGIILMSRASRSEVDLFGLLFGNILTVSDSEWHWLLFIGSIIMLVFGWMARAWWSIAFDATTAVASGLPVGVLSLCLYGTVGLTVVMCVKLAGIVLTTGLMVLPATCAWFWGRSFMGLWIISMLIALIATLLGLFISYTYDWPSGASIVLTLCIIFMMSWGAKWKQQHAR
ncbi:MAG: metal ABC transporter permease [Mariprofundaceae bacterium]|nr:metal ABC transporter permease [Mariprofundaceae bacterium]